MRIFILVAMIAMAGCTSLGTPAKVSAAPRGTPCPDGSTEVCRKFGASSEICECYDDAAIREGLARWQAMRR